MTQLTATATKSSLGAFVQARRRDAGLTQRQLAEAVFVTESAVSKWERGLSYPDIATVSALANALGVSESELINASEDTEARSAVKQARQYRRWRAGVFWTIALVLGAGVLASLVTNISVQHTLSWFWIVLAASIVAASVTLVPLSRFRTSPWAVFTGFVGSIVLMLGVVRLVVGGDFFVLAAASVICVALAIGIPFLITQGTASRTALILASYTALVGVYLLIVLLRVGRVETFFSTFGPIALLVLVPIWLGVLIAVYLPVARGQRTALIFMVVGIAVWFAAPALDSLLSRTPFGFPMIDFTSWTKVYFQGNVTAIVAGSLIVAGVAVGVISIVLRTTRRVSSSPESD